MVLTIEPIRPGMRVAFIGLGTMGLPMAKRLVNKPWRLVVWNRTASRAAEFASLNADVANSAAEAVLDSDVVCTMLADPQSLHHVCLGESMDGSSPHAIAAAMKPGSVLVDLSTVGPGALTPIRAALNRRGCTLVDAPVSGSREPAENGMLNVLVGGDAASIRTVRPVLECFGRVRVVGGPGAGAATKLTLNNLGAHMMSVLASSLVLAAKLGLDPAEVLKVIDEGPFRSPLFLGKGTRILDGRFEPADFTVELMRKDQDVVLENAARVGLQMPTLTAVRALIDQAVQQGDGDKDLCAIVRPLERQSQAEARRSPEKSQA